MGISSFLSRVSSVIVDFCMVKYLFCLLPISKFMLCCNTRDTLFIDKLWIVIVKSLIINFYGVCGRKTTPCTFEIFRFIVYFVSDNRAFG